MMMSAIAVRRWCWLHKWSSLLCTVFLLMLCITGLPLIFHHELDHLLGNSVEPPALSGNPPSATLDDVINAARHRYPSEVIQYVIWDPDDVNAITLIMAPSADALPEKTRSIVVDARTAQVLGEPKTQEGLTYFLFKLHVEMFAGLPGKLFLGFMGLLFLAALVSGAIVYGPFMRNLEFGTVRKERSPRLKWLDLHNLIGIVALVWMAVVGLTGAINTCADLVLEVWKADQLASMIAPYKGKTPAAQFNSLDEAIATAKKAAPEMTPSFVAYPGTLFSSSYHYAIFLRGQTPLTARLLQPALVDAETGTLTDTRKLPWYVTALLVSQPLHFGDYGGMPMKVIWALLTIATIIVLCSGLYLWFARRKTSVEMRLVEALPPEGVSATQAAFEPASTPTTISSEGSRFRRVFGIPITLALLSAIGLASALLSDGVGDALSWFALSVPVVSILWCLAGNQKPKRPRSRNSVPPTAKP